MQTMEEWDQNGYWTGLSPQSLLDLGAEFGYKMIYCDSKVEFCFLIKNNIPEI